MRYSHSSVDCFEKCKHKYEMRYIYGITTIPPAEPDNALIMGQTVHTGIEKSLEEAIKEYSFSYPIITDEHINEIIKFETVIPLARAAIPPGGAFEVEIADSDFHGFIDYLVPVGDGYFDLYDFKYSNNVSGYKQSNQLMTAKKTHVIINSPEELEALYKANIKEIWVGFNSRHYDQYILKAILCGFDPKKVNDYIITKGNPGWKFSSLFRQFPLWNYDVMLNTDVGLKSFEGFMGNDIKETSVPFNIDRKLTPEEIAETVKYCKHDVEQTVQVFLKRTEEFNTMMYFIKHFGLSMDYISKTKAQLAAEILGGNRKGADFDDEFQFPILDCLHLNKYKHIAEWYANPENHDYSKKQDKQIVAGVEHTFAWGGGHGARAKYSADGVFLIIDVTAYYPSLQKKYHFGYRVMNHPENFEFIHDSNIAYKRKGDKKARQPFKIMDNAISGQMKQKSSALYDPMSNNSICINGQLLLLDLVEHIEPYCELIQNNTDGIIVKLKDYEHDFDVLDDVVYEWEQRTGMKMDFDTYIGTIYQKDVNNYLLIDRKTGAVKAKGGYVMKLNDLSYDLPIINKALVDYMIHGIPVRRTIMECQDLREFQLVSRISSKYTHILYGDKPIKEKCIRVFASNNPADPGVKKVHAVRKTTAKLTNSPEHCFIFNDDVKSVPVPDKLDRQWYIDFANKRLSDFGVV